MRVLHEVITTLMLPPQLKDNGDFGAQTPLDLAGAGEAVIEILVGATDAAVGSTDEATPPILEECDTKSADAGDWSEIDGAELAAVIPADGDNKIYAIDVPHLAGRKRYVRVKAPHSADGDAGAYLAIVGRKARVATGPVTAADRGYAAHITAAS